MQDERILTVSSVDSSFDSFGAVHFDVTDHVLGFWCDLIGW